jgi:hypothetical protein
MPICVNPFANEDEEGIIQIILKIKPVTVQL